MTPIIRAMTLQDLEPIDLIERASFKEPWSPETFAAELAKPFARVDVARDREVIGFCNYWLLADAASLLVIAIHPDHRRRGVASCLLRHFLAQASLAQCALATLEVRRGNEPAIALYRRHGFITSYVRKQYYADGEDALVMNAVLSDAL